MQRQYENVGKGVIWIIWDILTFQKVNKSKPEIFSTVMLVDKSNIRKY